MTVEITVERVGHVSLPASQNVFVFSLKLGPELIKVYWECATKNYAKILRLVSSCFYTD